MLKEKEKKKWNQIFCCSTSLMFHCRFRITGAHLIMSNVWGVSWHSTPCFNDSSRSSLGNTSDSLYWHNTQQKMICLLRSRNFKGVVACINFVYGLSQKHNCLYFITCNSGGRKNTTCKKVQHQFWKIKNKDKNLSHSLLKPILIAVLKKNRLLCRRSYVRTHFVWYMKNSITQY